MNVKVGIVGLGFVGGAVNEVFEQKKIETIKYDKYKNIGNFESLLDSDIMFLCLPTPFIAEHGFDIEAILEVCYKLKACKYSGSVVIKSTIEPGTAEHLSQLFKLNIIHNPEFLTARTAVEDFKNQSHIVVGYTSRTEETHHMSNVIDLYTEAFPKAKISICSSQESESMKLFCNNFYAVKVGLANEFALLCQKIGANYERVKDMMVLNGWINPMHLDTPGHDGQRGWGGDCFPKDTEALSKFMKDKGSPNKIIQAAISENKKIRKDN